MELAHCHLLSPVPTHRLLTQDLGGAQCGGRGSAVELVKTVHTLLKSSKLAVSNTGYIAIFMCILIL